MTHHCAFLGLIRHPIGGRGLRSSLLFTWISHWSPAPVTTRIPSWSDKMLSKINLAGVSSHDTEINTMILLSLSNKISPISCIFLKLRFALCCRTHTSAVTVQFLSFKMISSLTCQVRELASLPTVMLIQVSMIFMRLISWLNFNCDWSMILLSFLKKNYNSNSALASNYDAHLSFPYLLMTHLLPKLQLWLS